MSEYLEIQAQIAELQRKAATIRATERAQALEKIKSLMSAFDIAASELSSTSSKSSKTRQPQKTNASKATRKVPAKYRDGNGNEWSGRGMQPRWFKAALASGIPVASLTV